VIALRPGESIVGDYVASLRRDPRFKMVSGFDCSREVTAL
jgi:hypothetical protein